MTLLMFAMALMLSAVAAFYAIFGLVAIFAAAPVAIIVMGSLLEGSKLVVASWLYRNWTEIPLLMKSYFTTSLIVLMFLTSMGIFGFLSRAHIEQKSTSQDTTIFVAEIDRQIEQEQAKIQDANTVIKQLDQAVQSLADAKRIRGASGSIAVRQSQAEERKQYNQAITEANQKIATLQTERIPLVQQQVALEAEVGPLKYIAALIYGDDPDASILEKSVRIVIIMIVAVFDPLAVLMLIAASWSLRREQQVVPHKELDLEIAPDTTPEVKEKVKEVMKEVVKEAQQKKQASRKVKPAPPPPAPAKAVEHPVFDSNTQWVSRPPPKS
jgi:hypothetical protein